MARRSNERQGDRKMKGSGAMSCCQWCLSRAMTLIQFGHLGIRLELSRDTKKRLAGQIMACVRCKDSRPPSQRIKAWPLASPPLSPLCFRRNRMMRGQQIGTP